MLARVPALSALRSPGWHPALFWAFLSLLMCFPAAMILCSARGADALELGILTIFVGPLLLAAVGIGWLLALMVQARLSRPLAILSLSLCLGLFFSVPLTNWPMRFVLALYRTQLDQFADQVQKGHLLPGAQQIGPLTVYQAEAVRPGGVVFWLDARSDHALLRCPPGLCGAFFGTGSRISIETQWQIVAED